MKKLFLFAFAAFALASCSDDEPVNPKPKLDLISFEEGDGLRDIEGKAVVLANAEVVGGSAAGKHQNVYLGKGGVFAGYYETAEWSGNFYDGFLCSTADEKIWFGTYYSEGLFEGQQNDNFGGFILTRNYNMTATAVDYKDQFSVWAKAGANGTKTCMVGYDSSWQGDSYALPTIEFIEPRTVYHLYMANSTVAYAYKPGAGVPQGETYYYKVVITGSLKGVTKGPVECELVKGDKKVADWVKVSLASLGEVDKLVFKPASNDLSGTYLNGPAYFGIDEIALVRK